MKLLFIARHFTYFRNYDSALRDLAARGHTIHLAVEREETLGGRAAVEALAREQPRISIGFVPERRADTWSGVARRLRLGLDYLRYLEPHYDTAQLRRVRARDRTPRLLIALADPPLLRGPRWRRLVGGFLHALDASVPPPASIVDFLREQRPDALLITPLVDLGSQQVDYVRAAATLGIPTALSVWSWDHLTSKAYLRDYPERVIVWNPIQRDEAIRVHRVPADRVVVTGAQCFDRWFDQRPSRSREAFCAELGLPAAGPLILYVCSGLIKGSPSEPAFVREWLQWLRQSDDPVVRNAAVLVRPHPSQTAGWQDVDLGDLGPVAIKGANPIDTQSRADYFDALYHSTAVVGLNTSAFVEAAIVGRQVLTVLVPRFHDNQDGTPHFSYLREVGGGVLRVAQTPAEHVAQLAMALTMPPAAEHPHRDFLLSFVRPHGLDRPATPEFVAAVEQLEHLPVAAQAAPWWGGTVRVMLGAAARATSRLAGESLVRSPRELDPARLARIAEAARTKPAERAR